MHSRLTRWVTGYYFLVYREKYVLVKFYLGYRLAKPYPSHHDEEFVVVFIGTTRNIKSNENPFNCVNTKSVYRSL